MGGEHHRRPVRHGFADQIAQEGAGGGVEAGVGLIEQPEGGPACDQCGQRHPSSLPGGEPAGRGAAEATHQAETIERRVAGRNREAEGAHGEADVLRRAELVVEGGGMAEEADVAAHGGVVGGEIDPEDMGFAGGDRQEAGAGPEQAGLPRTVGAEDQDDLAGLDREIDTGKGGEAAGECDGSGGIGRRGPWPSPPW